MTETNRQYLLKSRPVGMVGAEHFEFAESPAPAPGEGELLVRNLYISLDPAMRGWLNEGKSYVPPVGIGEVMRAMSVARVVASSHPKFAEGDVVSGIFGVQDYAVSDGKGVVKVDPSLAPLPRYLGTLGMPGMTAYFGLLEIGKPAAGETVVVSGATGAVGQVVGQVAKIKGCRVVGIAGGPEKCRHAVDELGYDACVDYKSENVKKALRGHCPDGVDVYFDNVGGEILDAVLTQLAMHARIVICGAISQYNSTEVQGPKNYMSLLVNRASMTGMVVFDYAKRYGDAVNDLASWLAKGEMSSQEHVIEGLDQFPNALLKLFTGENFGKLVLKVAD
ncbi:MAG: NADP-dependent oxidoreductase [Abyssibacter sp.]|uniref:NADP-dependent oxidoreductase n=1 Tax=Abyssibacter sp. TaxID=2320200 RepID=UPI00321908F8